MADRYWVGGTGTWSTTTTNWSTATALKFTASCSGTTLTTTGSPALVVGMTVFYGASSNLGTVTGGSGNTWTVSVGGAVASQTMTAATVGASVPTASDNTYFDTNSSSDSAFTVTISGLIRACRDFDVSGLTSNMTLTISGSVSFRPAGTILNFNSAFFSYTGSFNSVSWTAPASSTCTLSPKSGAVLTANFLMNTANVYNLGAAWTATLSTGQQIAVGSTFNTNNYALTWTTSFGSGSTLNAGSSAITFNARATTAFNIGTFNPGTSTVTYSFQATPTTTNPGLTGDGATLSFYNFIVDGYNGGTISVMIIQKPFTCTNFTVAAKTAAQTLNPLLLGGDVTVTGTFTSSAYPSVPGQCRALVSSTVFGTTRTITAAAVSLTDTLFSDITAAGAAAPFTGTRIGNAGGNSNITFTTARNIYWTKTAGGTEVPSASFSSSSGGAATYLDNPLPQDTIIFDDASLTGASPSAQLSGSLLGLFGKIDASARTAATLYIGTSSAIVIGDIVGSSATPIFLGGTLFWNRSPITVTAPNYYNNIQTIQVSTLSTVTLVYGFSATTANQINLNFGTLILGANCSVGQFATTRSSTKDYNYATPPASRSGTLDTGSYALTFTSSFTNSSAGSLGTGLTAIGTVRASSATALSFSGGGGTYSSLTIDQGNAGALTISGNNTFANITNSYSATGATTVKFTSGSTNTFTAFNLTGSAGNVCTLGASTTSQATLIKSTPWYMGANSTDGGNNTGLTFTAGDGIDYLSVSYIKGSLPPGPSSGKMFLMF